MHTKNITLTDLGTLGRRICIFFTSWDETTFPRRPKSDSSKIENFVSFQRSLISQICPIPQNLIFFISFSEKRGLKWANVLSEDFSSAKLNSAKIPLHKV